MSGNFCSFCRSNQFSFFLESTGVLDGKNYTLLLCRTCGIVRTAGFKSVDYSPELNYKYSGSQKSLFQKIEFCYIKMRWRHEVLFLKRFLREDAALLDIGSGNGLFLNECKNMKIQAEGVEKFIDSKFAQNSSPKVYALDIESDELPDNDYDCVTLYHSLEHLDEPSMVLQKLRRVLRRDGLLLVQVPNIDSWQFRLFKGRWFHLFLPYHRIHFSAGTLKGLLEKNGFSIIHTRHFSNRWNAEGWSASILKWNPVYFLKKKSENNKLIIQKFIYLLLTVIFIPVSLLESIFKKGGVITLIARKVN